MDRTDLVEELAQVLNVSRKEAKTVLEAILDSIVHALRNGERIEIRRFGTLSTHIRPPRRGRNPKSGTPVPVPSKRVLKFRAATELKALVNQFGGSASVLRPVVR